jgi:hypothetical protein
MSCYKRDYDFLGYRYALMSQLASAGLNNVLCMIPARDESEFSLFPDEDVAFIRGWLAWTDAHIEFLKNTVPLPNMDEVGLGLVDGSAAFAHPLSCNFTAVDSDNAPQNADTALGFIWLFNPGYSATRASVMIDDSLSPFDSCIASAATGDGVKLMQAQYYDVKQLYPTPGKTERVAFGSEYTSELAGSSAVMLQVSASAAVLDKPILLGVTASAVLFDATEGSLELIDVVGEIGTVVRHVLVQLPLDTAGGCQSLQMRALTVNRRAFEIQADARFARSGTRATLSRDGRCEIRLPPLRFGGAAAPFPHAAPIVLTSGPTDPDGNATFTGSTTVPKAIFEQLHARQLAYPVSQKLSI